MVDEEDQPDVLAQNTLEFRYGVSAPIHCRQMFLDFPEMLEMILQVLYTSGRNG